MQAHLPLPVVADRLYQWAEKAGTAARASGGNTVSATRYHALRDQYLTLAESVRHAIAAPQPRQRQASVSRTARQPQDATSRQPRQALTVFAGARFRGFADFQAAFLAAKQAALAAYGDRWYLSLQACIKARVPAPWVRCVIGHRAINTPRDLNFPVAEFWPRGRLPIGPAYAMPDNGRRLASVKVTSMITGVEVEMHPFEIPAFMARQEEQARKMRSRIAHARADLDEETADQLAAD